jgi:ABC-type antimicrobial peptide transport system permease subunit
MNVLNGDIKMAFHSVRSTRWRSLLTTSGIIIGICSVVTIVGLGEGIKHQVANQIDQLGKNLITIRPGTGSYRGINSLSIFNSNGLSDGGLSDKELQAVNQTQNVSKVSPMSVIPGNVSVDSQSPGGILVIGASDSIPSLLNQSLQYGDYFDSTDDTQPVAVLGSGAADALFPGQVPLGMSFNFHGVSFTVRGEFNQFDIAPLSLDANFNNAIFIPYQVAKHLEGGTAPIYEILARPSDSAQAPDVASAINSRLLALNGGVQNFSVLTQQDSLSATNNILNLLTKLIGAVAAVSLLVGGIGVMNIMLVAVTERTHEIGIRKALGATDRQILEQFLIESIILSLMGGIVGILLSVLVNVSLRVTTSLQPELSWQIMLISSGVSIIVGVIFGIAPAFKAARKNPIDALRAYQ